MFIPFLNKTSMYREKIIPAYRPSFRKGKPIINYLNSCSPWDKYTMAVDGSPKPVIGNTTPFQHLVYLSEFVFLTCGQKIWPPWKSVIYVIDSFPKGKPTHSKVYKIKPLARLPGSKLSLLTRQTSIASQDPKTAASWPFPRPSGWPQSLGFQMVWLVPKKVD